MEIMEPTYYVRICVERELTDVEFNDITEVIDDEIGDIVNSDDVIEHLNESGMYCYMFELSSDLDRSEQGIMAGDLISYEIDQVLPPGMKWELEASTEDVELDVPDDATESQINEAAVNYFRNILKG